MKLLVIGATGMIGSRIVAEAAARGHDITAASRKGDAPAGNRVRPLALDLGDTAALARAAALADVIVGAVSPRQGGAPADEAATYVTAMIGAAETSGRRLMIVGGAGTLNLPDGRPVADVVPPPYADEARAMRAAHDLLAASSVDYTFFAPAGQIAPGTRTGAFRLGGRDYLTDANGESRISAEDYAVAFVDEIETPAHRRQVMTAAY